MQFKVHYSGWSKKYASSFHSISASYRAYIIFKSFSIHILFYMSFLLNRWDEWVPTSRLLKHTPENIEHMNKMKELEKKRAEEGRNRFAVLIL